MNKTLLALLFAALAISSCAARAASESDDKTLSPYFWVKPTAAGNSDTSGTLDALPLKSTRVEALVSGVIADVTVTQTYTNTGTVPLEAVYLFPGSTRAAVHGLTLSIGDRRIEARVKKREEAHQIYETAKAEGKTASLLEQHRPNVFQMNVANILPGDEVKVELHYTELLVPTGGVYEFVYPGVVGPRYSNKSAEGAAPGDTWTANPYLPQGHHDPARYDLSVHLAAGLPLQDIRCLTHNARIAYTSDREASVSTSPDDPEASNHDFILCYRLAGGAIQSGLLLAEGREENYFLLMVQPPARPAAAQIPARDYLFVVDVSGSMHGFPLTVSKHLVRDLLTSLRPTDTFNILLFSGDSRMLSPQPLPATAENISTAVDLLDKECGGGGTELLSALKSAFATPRPENASRSVVVITDGYVDIEDEAFDLVRSNLGQANLFAFGIGSSVNRHLIEGLARAGQGEPFIVENADRAPAAAAKFREYVATPVLTQVKVAFDGFATYDVEPVAVPDVLARRPVVVFGKWKGPKTGAVTVTGITGAQNYSTTLQVQDAAVLPSDAGLAHLWARSRIAQLSDRMGSRDAEERKTEITSLGLTYNLLTRYTSFVAVDDIVRRASGNLQTVKQPLPLPQGVENSAVGGNIPTSPEPATLGLMVIVAALFLAVLIRPRKKQP